MLISHHAGICDTHLPACCMYTYLLTYVYDTYVCRVHSYMYVQSTCDGVPLFTLDVCADYVMCDVCAMYVQDVCAMYLRDVCAMYVR